MHISWLHRLLVAFVAAIGMAGAAQAKDLLVLADDIPAGLDYDGPTASLIPTYGGIANLLEPLVYYAAGEVNEEGVQLLDFNKFEGRLAKSWIYDPETFTWTFTLRQGVKGCNRGFLPHSPPSLRTSFHPYCPASFGMDLPSKSSSWISTAGILCCIAGEGATRRTWVAADQVRTESYYRTRSS